MRGVEGIEIGARARVGERLAQFESIRTDQPGKSPRGRASQTELEAARGAMPLLIFGVIVGVRCPELRVSPVAVEAIVDGGIGVSGDAGQGQRRKA